MEHGYMKILEFIALPILHSCQKERKGQKYLENYSYLKTYEGVLTLILRCYSGFHLDTMEC